ncbi:MAG: hypothetical protein K2K57_04240 [Oscillospiraceae bacterium]|nr:hypothetical protein [Oscillospiraceae bacterium]
MDRSLIIAVLSLLLGAVLIIGAIRYVGSGNIGSAENADISVIPTAVAYTGSDVYTTYYGTFEPIPEVLEKNEYMTLHPTVLTVDQSNWYVTEQDDEDREEILGKISALSDEICNGQETERNKAYAIAMWVGQNVAYDFDAEENGSARDVISLESILENDFRTTCGGFANLYAALCNAQGIYCLCLKGGSVSEGYTRGELADIPSNHNWNAVAADGEWYYVDCTWISDLSYRSGKTISASEVRSFYALMGFGEMSIEHRIDRCEYRSFGIDE